MRRRAMASLGLVGLLGAGCAAFVEKSDYADYRALRVERDDGRRLLAMQTYVARHPKGHYLAEVQAQRAPRDREQFEAGRSTRAGLEFYLTAFPDGTFVAQARARLAAIDVIERRQRDEAARAQRIAAERKAREAELSRTWVTRFVAYWMRTLLALQNWGAPIEQVARGNAGFSRAFGRAPRPRCTADECVKYYESAYAVPIPGGTRLERSFQLLLRLRLDKGRLVRAELLLPSLGFSRWSEVEQRKVVVDGDPDDRKRALQWALARVSTVLDEVASNRRPIEGFAAEVVPKPAIGPSGELVDTTAEDPSAPANRIQGEGAPAPEPSAEQLVKPSAPEQAADLEMSPLQVTPQGTPAPSGGEMVMAPMAVPPQPAASEGEVMEMAPLAVPSNEASARAAGAAAVPAGSSAGTNAAAAPAQAAPGLTQAYRTAGLRIVIFAAATSDASPAYDGLAIELDATPEPGPPSEPSKKPTSPAKPAATKRPTVVAPTAAH